ncbi:N,N'-diacetyllegionaminic acid synthase [Kordia antarctica]|uniref:N,N'-diacetyllegionaminic acid synthase n=1 Tax=Kordia antarctica TaxID=1218801 RepID=A0A7L4ZH50_9FLAO|nr:N-acetylneuraminate synthase family protein [Kordia antarctica]QHI35234.1 N,N'-diacetyllegionaminic acid synthase [Kordia antarctica]
MKKTYIIAEIGQAHDGSLGMAHAYIDAVAKTGANAIKFQTHIAAAESSIHEPFRVKFSKQDATRYEYWQRMEFSLEQWITLKTHCDEVGLDFISSPFSNAAVDLLEEIGVKLYKVGSGEVNNFLLLEKIANTGKPIIISSGMSSFEELDETVAFLKEKKCEFSILQCTTSYPTAPKQFGLNVIQELKERYQVSVGFSDHSSGIEAGIAAVTLGAEILEFHVVFDKEMFGPDAKSSLTFPETAQLVKAVRNIDEALNHPIDKKDNSQFSELKQIFEKSLAINKNLSKGHILTFNDLEAKKPKNYGILASKFQEVIGKKLIKEMKQWDFLNESDVS